jgi:hypothetical protein
VNKFSRAKSDGNVCTDMFVGMDLHKSYLQIAVLDGKGKVLKNSRIHNDLSKLGRFFDRIGGSGNSSDVDCVQQNVLLLLQISSGLFLPRIRLTGSQSSIGGGFGFDRACTDILDKPNK